MPFKFNIYYTLLLVTIRRQWKGKRIVGGYFLNQKRKRTKRNVDKVLYYNAFYIYLGMKIGEEKKKKRSSNYEISLVLCEQTKDLHQNL